MGVPRWDEEETPIAPVMLILRGIAGTFNGKSYPQGALDEASAKDYARLRGYEPRVLDVSGEASVGSKQHKAALQAFRADPNIKALYGFSGGAYNLAHVLDDLTATEKGMVDLVVALGAPGNSASRYAGPWETVYRKDPPSGHMDGPRVLLADAQKEQASKPTTAAMPLRYLIAVEDQLTGRPDEMIEVGYDGPKPTIGPAVRYGNLFDQTGTGAYGPYLKGTDTANQYDERVVDPLGDGWMKLLADQCNAAKAASFDTIEWDNPDGYGQLDVLNAVQCAANHGLKVLAKNPLICDWDCVPYVAHPTVVGIVVEKDEYTAKPALYDDLRIAAGKPDLPVWFVAFKDGKEDGKAWAAATAREAANYRSMFVTYSPDGEYTSSIDLPVAAESPPLAPPAVAVDHFPDCVKLLLVHEGGNDDDPRDPGGRTSRGVTQREYSTWRNDHSGLPADVWQAPQATVLAIYRAKYWNAMRCDDLPAGIDYCVFDYGVNSGLGRAIPLLQKTLGLAVDGAMGPITIAAAKAADPVAFIKRYQDARLSFLHGLGSWSVFGRGWGTRVADVRRDALKMAGGGVVAQPAPPSPGPSAPVYDTAWVQQTLNQLGATPPLTEDGKMGPRTRAEIIKFQSAHGLKPDGVAGPLTRTEMVQALNVEPVPILPPLPKPPGEQPPVEQGRPLLDRVIAGMEALGYRIDKGPGEINIAYAEGHERSGERNANTPGLWNDVRMVFSYEAGEPVLLGAWTATTQPGPYYTINPINKAGAANIFPGQYTAWRVALHRGQYEALCQRGKLKLTRDKNKDYKREGDAVEVGSEEGINMHHGSNASTVGPHSAGCLVGKNVDGHEDFMSICKSDPRYKADHNFMFTGAILMQSEVPL